MVIEYLLLYNVKVIESKFNLYISRLLFGEVYNLRIRNIIYIDLGKN